MSLDAPINGLILVDKPSGPTSFDLVKAIRKVSGQKSVGHIGTLDPLATGLMGLVLGTATRLASYLTGHDKTYLATVVLGLQTDTDDVTGAVLGQFIGQYPSKEEVQKALASFVGTLDQRPPNYSAKKVGGKTAHKLARAGENVELASQKVTAYALTLEAYNPPVVVFRAKVSAGYYIRSLARDLGQELGLGGGALKALRRERIGDFGLEEARGLPQSRAELLARLISPRAALAGWPEVLVSALEAEKLAHGQGVRLANNLTALSLLGPNEGRKNPLVKIIEPQDQLLGLGYLEPPIMGDLGQEPPGPFLRPSRVFKPR
ncbi:MAG: tRNA pseudouridine(55) synthase TruB [Deltaproteobacteria bacterium]|nr:tRNA pseudouridine(55) synthase TruB [Deltaproteobacteria bacterium]